MLPLKGSPNNFPATARVFGDFVKFFGGPLSSAYLQRFPSSSYDEGQYLLLFYEFLCMFDCLLDPGTLIFVVTGYYIVDFDTIAFYKYVY